VAFKAVATTLLLLFIINTPAFKASRKPKLRGQVTTNVTVHKTGNYFMICIFGKKLLQEATGTRCRRVYAVAKNYANSFVKQQSLTIAEIGICSTLKNSGSAFGLIC